MKQVFALMVVLMLLGSAMADTGIDWSEYPDDSLRSTIEELQEMLNEANVELSKREAGQSYSIGGTDFTVDFYRNMLTQKYQRLLVKVHWTNNTSSAKSFIWLLSVNGYQDGKELDSSYRPQSFGGDDETDNILPGYSATACLLFSLKNDSDVRIIINDWLHPGNANGGIVFDLNIDSLPWCEEES